MTLWTSDEAETATLGQASKPFAVKGLSIDTRTLKEGDLFVALKGARDGHDFVRAAFDAKAGAALVSHAPPDANGPTLPAVFGTSVLQAQISQQLGQSLGNTSTSQSNCDLSDPACSGDQSNGQTPGENVTPDLYSVG